MTNQPWSTSEVLGWATEDFRRRGLPTPRLDAELLLAHVLGSDRIRLILDHARHLEEPELAAFRGVIQRRRRGEPVAYIRGEREFYGLVFRVDGRVLVPRPETETLVDVALERTRRRALYGRALDLGTGSGCVALSFARQRPTWRVAAVDASEGALEVAAQNALCLGLSASTSLLSGDLFSALPEPHRGFDLVMANPPYIPTGELSTLSRDIIDFEPHLALDGGVDGLSVLRRIVEQTPQHLAPGGVLALEVGFGQAGAVQELMRARGFQGVETKKDYGGHERVVSGTYGPP